jgi:PAS domain S-box-containing protein
MSGDVATGVGQGGLPEQQALVEALAETSHSLVCIFDREGRIVGFNHVCEEATGYTAAEVLGRDARELVIPPEDRELFDEFLREVWQTRLPSPQLGQWLTRDGGRRIVAWANRPLLGPDGQALYLVTAGLDVTEREEMIARLERTQEELHRSLAEQSALRRVATLVASGGAPEAVFDAVSEEAARVVGADVAAVTRFDGDDGLVVGEYAAPGAPTLGKGSLFPLGGDGSLSRVRAGAPSARIDDYAGVTGDVLEVVRSQGLVSTVATAIGVGGETWGGLIVGSSRAAPLPPDAEERLVEFGRLCSLAIASADSLQQLLTSREQLAQAAALERSRSAELQRLLAEQAALRRVATLVAGDVSEGVARAVGSESGAVARYDHVAETATIVGRWDDARYRGVPLGTTVSVHAPGVMGQVFHTRQPARIDDYSHVPGNPAEDLRRHGIHSVVAAPVVVGNRLWGALAVGTASSARMPDGTEERLERFANLTAIAVSSAQAWEELLESRARVVQAADDERRRLGRNLHDGAQQRLVTVLTFLRIAESRFDSDPAKARDLLAQSIEEIVNANQDLRELARGLHPVALSERGLDAALRTLTRNASIDVELDVCDERLPEPIEAAMYYVAAEALANAGKYAGAECVWITVNCANGHARLEVRDDGVGGADPLKGTGLRGLIDRVEALRGQLEIDTSARGGTTIRARFPLD